MQEEGRAFNCAHMLRECIRTIDQYRLLRPIPIPIPLKVNEYENETVLSYLCHCIITLLPSQPLLSAIHRLFLSPFHKSTVIHVSHLVFLNDFCACHDNHA